MRDMDGAIEGVAALSRPSAFQTACFDATARTFTTRLLRRTGDGKTQMREKFRLDVKAKAKRVEKGASCGMSVTLRRVTQIIAFGAVYLAFGRKEFPNRPVFDVQTKFLRQFLHATRCNHQNMGIAFALHPHTLIFNKAAFEDVLPR